MRLPRAPSTVYDRPMQVDILALDGSSPAALGTSLDAFALANDRVGREAFHCRIVTGTGAHATLRHGASIAAVPLRQAKPAELVVVLGVGTTTVSALQRRLERADAHLATQWVSSAAAAGSHMAASCSAVFILGASSLLDERDCTTAPWLRAALAQRHPAARVRTGARVVGDGTILTAGAGAAHLELMLALVARFESKSVADDVAEVLTGEGGSTSDRDIPPCYAPPQRLATFLDAFARRHIDRPLSVVDLAAVAGTSPRTLTRRIRIATGTSPARFIERIRLDVALQLIAQTTLPLAAIATRVGYADASVLHRLVRRHTRRSPGSFRTTAGILAGP